VVPLVLPQELHQSNCADLGRRRERQKIKGLQFAVYNGMKNQMANKSGKLLTTNPAVLRDGTGQKSSMTDGFAEL